MAEPIIRIVGSGTIGAHSVLNADTYTQMSITMAIGKIMFYTVRVKKNGLTESNTKAILRMATDMGMVKWNMLMDQNTKACSRMT